jgi:hypothetical protein
VSLRCCMLVFKCATQPQAAAACTDVMAYLREGCSCCC